jgi:hypothetical protein
LPRRREPQRDERIEDAGEHEEAEKGERDRRNGTTWGALTRERRNDANEEHLRIRYDRCEANPEEWDRDVETLQVEREERTRCEPEQAVAPGRAMPLAMGKDGQEGEGDRAAEERDDCW